MRAVFVYVSNSFNLILRNVFEKEIKEKRFFLIKSSPQGQSFNSLRKAITRYQCDLGITFDFDGDRVFFMDDKLRLMPAEIILQLLIFSEKPKKIVIEPSIGWVITKGIIHNSKFIIHKSRAGHYFIKKKMNKEKADLGGEWSGHYYFAFNNFGKERVYFDSGVLTSIKVLNALYKLPYSLSGFYDLFPHFPAYSRNFSFKFKKDFSEISSRIKKSFKKCHFSDLDGLKIENKDFWLLIRPSSTEPVLRLKIEAKTDKILRKIKKRVIRILEA